MIDPQSSSSESEGAGSESQVSTEPLDISAVVRPSEAQERLEIFARVSKQSRSKRQPDAASSVALVVTYVLSAVSLAVALIATFYR